MSSRAGAGSRKKIHGAGAAPKQAGSETVVSNSVSDPEPDPDSGVLWIRVQGLKKGQQG